MITKQQIRREMASRRRSLDPDARAAASRQITDRLCALEAFRTAEIVGLYLALPDEVDVDSLLETCRAAGKQTAVPVFNGQTRCYEMSLISADTPMRTGHYGIREPQTSVRCPLEQIGLLVVPGVAFDPAGRRLGRGGGHYDRLLTGFSGVSAAAAFDFQLVPGLPVEPHDRPVRIIVTENQVINVVKED